MLTLRLICKEVVNLRNSTVESDHINTVISSVKDQVLAHDGQANKAEVSSGRIVSRLSFWRVRKPARRPADVDAGEARTASWKGLQSGESLLKMKPMWCLQLLRRN